MGKRRLEKAIEKAKTILPDIEFDISWRPFQLNPSAEEGKGVNKLEMYNKKFGKERVAAMVPHMTAVGKEEGISFSYGGYTGNTFDSHRIILAAKEQGGAELQNQVVESLFKAYFEDEKSMGDHEVLLDYAGRAGMNEVSALLSDSAMYRDDVQAEILAYGKQCQGVPMFIVDHRFALSGAQDADALLQVFQQALSKQ